MTITIQRVFFSSELKVKKIQDNSNDNYDNDGHNYNGIRRIIINLLEEWGCLVFFFSFASIRSSVYQIITGILK